MILAAGYQAAEMLSGAAGKLVGIGSGWPSAMALARLHEAVGCALGLHRGGNNSPIANFGGHGQQAMDGNTIANLLSSLWKYPYP